MTLCVHCLLMPYIWVSARNKFSGGNLCLIHKACAVALLNATNGHTCDVTWRHLHGGQAYLTNIGKVLNHFHLNISSIVPATGHIFRHHEQTFLVKGKVNIHQLETVRHLKGVQLSVALRLIIINSVCHRLIVRQRPTEVPLMGLHFPHDSHSRNGKALGWSSISLWLRIGRCPSKTDMLHSHAPLSIQPARFSPSAGRGLIVTEA